VTDADTLTEVHAALDVCIRTAADLPMMQQGQPTGAWYRIRLLESVVLAADAIILAAKVIPPRHVRDLAALDGIELRMNELCDELADVIGAPVPT